MSKSQLHRPGGPSSTLVTLLAAGLGVAIPVLIAIVLAARQGRATEMRLVATYASNILQRAETTTEQGFEAINTLENRHSPDPCSNGNLDLMRRFDLESGYLQAVGYVAGDRLVCSSQGREGVDFALGPVDWSTPTGIHIRLNVRFPFDLKNAYMVVERDGYAVIINKSLPLDATTNEKDVSLAFFAPFNGRIMAARGTVNPRWMGPLSAVQPPERTVRTFIDGGHVVAVARSGRYLLATVAALPVSYIQTQERTTALILLPAGLLAGVGLAFAMLRLVRQQVSLPAMLRTALRRNEFFMVYQPIIDLRTGRWVGAEALLRWRLGNGEMRRPDLFIPAAEDLGMMPQLTRRVLELVERDLSDVFRRHSGFRLAINLSPKDLEGREVVDWLRRLARASRAVHGSLVVEVTERGFLNHELALATLHELRTSGIKVAIDDFGTGYSSLAYLERFNIDYLKIDKLFVDTMNLDSPTSQVALHIIEMAKSLKLQMIAEGVEMQAQAEFLRQRGVQYAQGFLFSEPLPADALLTQLSRQQREAGAPRVVAG